MIGKSVAHYKILEKIGQGGMGMVYKAQDQKLGRFVALKFLPPQVSSDDEQKQRFINEAKTASAIDHPNIGGIYEINETEDEQIYIAMAYYEGDTLKKKIESGPLPYSQLLDYALQVSGGLAKAHERGIVHRDFKPANVIITNDGIAKIIDFGLAKLKGGGQLTRSGVSMGTVAYMSPEQARGEEVDQRTDVWAFGVVLYEMASGRLPFQGEFEAAMLYLIVNEEPPPLHTLRTDIPAELSDIISKALNKDQAKRYQNIADAFNDLTQFKKNLESGAGQKLSKATIAVRIPTLRVTITSKVLLYSLGAVMLCVVGWLIYVLLLGERGLTAADRSIVVLPIVNPLDREFEYLSEGVTSDIISSLGKDSNLTVVSKNTSFLYKLTSLTNLQLAEALGIRFVLKGSLRMIGQSLFLDVSMYDSKEQKDIYSHSFEKLRTDLMLVETEIVTSVLEELGVQRSAVQQKKYQSSPEVYEAFLRGRYHFEKTTEADNSLAMEFFSEALHKDTSYNPARVFLAEAQSISYEMGWNQKDEVLNQSEQNASQAIRQDSSMAQAYAVLSDVERLRGHLPASIKLLEQTLQKQPNNSLALTKLGIAYLIDLGQPARGVFYFKKLQEVDPTDWENNMHIGIGYAQQKQYELAIENFRKTIRLNPDNSVVWTNLGYALERIGQYDTAAVCYRTAIAMKQSGDDAYKNLIDLLLSRNQFASAESLLAGALQIMPTNHELMYRLGVTYVSLAKKGDAKKIFENGVRYVEDRLLNNDRNGMNYADHALFLARLNKRTEAVRATMTAFRLDSTDNEIVIKIVRVHAVLGDKNAMLQWFKRAKAMNVEYDAAYLATAIDFEQYRRDPDLLLIAQQK